MFAAAAAVLLLFLLLTSLMQLYICLLSFLSCCCFIDELQLLFSQKQQQHLFNLTSVCVNAFVYVSVWSPARTPLYLCIRLSLFLPTSHILVFMCVCECVCLRLFVSAAVAGTALQLPVGKDEFTLLFSSSSASPCCCCCLCRTPSLSHYKTYLPLPLQFRQIVLMFEKGGKQQCCQIVQPFALEAHEKKSLH